jgi:hypothetical protein
MTTTTTESTEQVTYEKGTWQADLDRSVKMADKGQEFKKKAGALLWKGATTAINHWTDEADNDQQGEGLAADLLAVMGNSRKGDVSKIKTVALAVRNKGLRLDDYPNLSKAYTAARALTVVAEEHADEDDVLTSVMETVAEQAKSVNVQATKEQAALVLFADGEDEAFRVIGDMLGSDDARRAALRAFAADISGRVAEVKAAEKAKADEAKAAKKAEVDKAKAEKAQAKAKADEEKAAAKKAAAKTTTAKPKATAKATTAKATAPKPTAKPKAVAKPKAATTA